MQIHWINMQIFFFQVCLNFHKIDYFPVCLQDRQESRERDRGWHTRHKYMVLVSCALTHHNFFNWCGQLNSKQLLIYTSNRYRATFWFIWIMDTYWIEANVNCWRLKIELKESGLLDFHALASWKKWCRWKNDDVSVCAGYVNKQRLLMRVISTL